MTDARRGAEIAVPWFREIVGSDPYPWQRRMYGEFVEGDVPEAVDVPTGLGKTLCVLLFLLARIRNPALPARIVYVVDRRAIVDQTAEAIRAWIERIVALPALADAFDRCSAFARLSPDRPVQLGVLRGGMADDGEWRVDPARPAVVVGTVDMIGSRVLFSGYGDGRSRRPMHAGLLGHDSIVMLDEAHLSPAMDAFLRAVEGIQGHPKFRTMTLSATGAKASAAFSLSAKDEENPEVRRRLHAVKTPQFHPVEKPADRNRIDRICELAAAHRSGSVAVFVGTVADAGKIADKLTKKLGAGGAERVALLTGTLRGKERAGLAAGAVWRRFHPDRDRDAGAPAVYLVMTSAGEVGVDLDADHAVMDLATLDSMIQRVGRVNRSGRVEAEVAVVHTRKEEEIPDDGKPPTTRRQKLDAARAKTLEVLQGLPGLSPATLKDIDKPALETCSAPSPRPARLHAEVVEAFAATSAALRLPPVSVYLRGVSEDPETPESFLLWRREREVAALVRLGEGVAGEALAFFRPSADEIARVPASEARNLVRSAVPRQGDDGLPLIVIEPGGDVFAKVVKSEGEIPSLGYATVVLPTTAGGLEPSGLPSGTAKGEVSDVGDGDDRYRYEEPAPGGEEREDGEEAEEAEDESAAPRPDWLKKAVELRIPLPDEGADDAGERFLVYALRRPDPTLQSGEGETTWLGASTQTVDEHCALVGDAARRIGAALSLTDAETAALEAAGRWHDRGKARRVWQRAAGAPADGPPLAKSTKGRLRSWMLGGYRHEFGSLVEAEREIPVDAPNRDLVLHLIAAHHGWARPGFPHPRQWDPDVPVELNRKLAVEAANRFARLQAKYGPWRLAWLEALLKAADAHASRAPGRGEA